MTAITRSVVLENLLIAVKGPAIGLKSDLQIRKTEVDFVRTNGIVGLPSRNTCLAHQFDE
jgi:hypothetical protein